MGFETPKKGGEKMQKVLKVQEVAEMFRVSPQLVYDAVSQGELKAIRVRRLIRIREDDLNRWIEKNSNQRQKE